MSSAETVTRTAWIDDDGAWRTTLRGHQLLADPRLNKGTAFPPPERAALGLNGVLPPRVATLEEQVRRVYAQYQSQPTGLAKHVTLTELHDRNQVLFYRLLADHLSELLPIVYTPVVGEAIEHYSDQFRRPRGAYLSAGHPDWIESSLREAAHGADDIDLIVATDAEAILGIGDWGVGGIGIAVGKLAVYTAAAGIDPNRAIAVTLDVGTNRQALLDDPFYLGNGHRRIPQSEYDGFIDEYVRTATRLYPGALLHWEDFGASNARRILERYGDQVLTLNDDMQGTGAVNLAAVLSGARATGRPLGGHRVVIFGSGTAGIGIADMLRQAMVLDGLSEQEATQRFWCLDREGLITAGAAGTADFQRPYARPLADVEGFERDERLGGVGLREIVRRVHPTILIGTSAQPHAFGEDIVREMAAHTERPIILPLSNPTSLSEADPVDLIRWTGGRALVATGSPFGPVVQDGVTYEIAQANNALVFPGLGLGTIAAGATRVTDGMLLAAARALSSLAEVTTLGAPLLPGVDDLRATSAAVAAAVAHAADRDGVARAPGDGDRRDRIAAAMWTPAYRPVLPA
jgi:malate dehydrogenase (oxaloacetate-decarboxylating)